MAIHLWSKKEAQVIKVGSLQFFSEADTSKSSSLKLNEWWLLLLRMLIITMLVILLAKPRISTAIDNRAVVYLVEQSLLDDPHVSSMMDSLAAHEPVQLLESGFPLLHDRKETTTMYRPNYWQLVDEMDTLHADSIVIFTNAYIAGLKGKRPKTALNLTWITLDAIKPQKHLIEAASAAQKIHFIATTPDAGALVFDKGSVTDRNLADMGLELRGDSLYQEGDSRGVPLDPLKSIHVLVVYDPSFVDDMKYISIAFNTLSTFLEQPISISASLAENAILDSLQSPDVLVWLSQQSDLPKAGKVLIYQPDSLASSLVQQVSADQYYLTERLNGGNAVYNKLPAQLLPLLDLHPRWEQKAAAYDYRTVDNEMIQPAGHTAVALNNIHYIGISLWLWTALILMMMAERALAWRRGQ